MRELKGTSLHASARFRHRAKVAVPPAQWRTRQAAGNDHGAAKTPGGGKKRRKESGAMSQRHLRRPMLEALDRKRIQVRSHDFGRGPNPVGGDQVLTAF